jgi:hypothetical protein
LGVEVRLVVVENFAWVVNVDIAALQFAEELSVNVPANEPDDVAKAASVALRDVPVSCSCSVYGVPAVTVPE